MLAPMSEQPGIQSPPPLLSIPIKQNPCLAPLQKQKSWSPDIYREEAWLKKKNRWKKNQRRSKSVTDEDLDELKGCIELGFSFDSPELDPKLSDTLPAYEFYYAVNKHYYDTISKSSGSLTTSSSDCSDIATSSNSPVGSPLTMFSPGDDPKRVKTRLRQWAQVVACSVKQSWR